MKSGFLQRAQTLKLSLVLFSALLSACSGIDNNHVPVGTWQHVEKQRYMTIEPDGESYKAVLFSVYESGAKKTVMQEKSLPAKMTAGVLILKANNDVDISVLYHPDGSLILVNGTTEFRRVPDELAQLTFGKFQNSSH